MPRIGSAEITSGLPVIRQEPGKARLQGQVCGISRETLAVFSIFLRLCLGLAGSFPADHIFDLLAIEHRRDINLRHVRSSSRGS
jgi:hypothetical protein